MNECTFKPKTNQGQNKDILRHIMNEPTLNENEQQLPSYYQMDDMNSIDG